MATASQLQGNRRSARERVLDAAGTLFYAHGISATGIDAITAKAGVAKMSLYNNFASKGALVEAYIGARHEEWLALYRARLTSATSPKDGVLAIFGAYIDHASLAYDQGFRGCGLLNAAAELEQNEPARLAVRRHKELVEHLLTDHLQELAGDDRAAELAEHLSFLLEGAMARAGLEGQDARLHRAIGIARSLLDAA